ncbi:hypothetical protein ABIE26_001133 [Pedobacter africanus]|uniref:Uncharacterized protein n=1 Tax=Pedobacter africanus TaxID=151894 RepID=A0ACC6KSS3_9SPHI|nr:PKD-like family lipoprotein [Pedobacter africanus]MDR6782379.1 hypothetical protein [Pedobacter africanus]
MRIKEIISGTLIGCTLLFACKKDNNKYTYDAINELTIKGSQQDLMVVQRDTIRINPDITESLPGSGPYTYKWEIYRFEDVKSYEVTVLNPANKSTTVSTEKNLKVPALVAPGTYRLQYTITDSKTNLRTSVRYMLTVNGKYYEGWLVMADKGGKTILSFVRQDDVVFNDVIGASNPSLTVSGKPLAAFSGIHAKLEDVNVFTDQGMYRFSANDFSFTGKSPDLFETAINPVSNPGYAVNSVNFDQYVVSNGNVYGTLTPAQGLAKYSERFNGPAGYSVFPYFMSGRTYWTLFYDNTGKRFLHTSYTSRSFSTFPSVIDKEIPFNMSDVGKTLIGGDKGPDNEYFLVMRDGTGYYLCSVLPNNKQPAGLMDKMDGAPEIDKALIFAASEVNKQLYYAVANKIYLYDVLAKTARLVYTFPANTLIKDMKMFKGLGWGKANTAYNTRLVVGTYNGAEGELYYFNLMLTGDIANSTYSKKFGGFDNIVHINYRIPNL